MAWKYWTTDSKARVRRVHDSFADGRPHAGVTCDGGHLVRARVNTMAIIPTDDEARDKEDFRYIYGAFFYYYYYYSFIPVALFRG